MPHLSMTHSGPRLRVPADARPDYDLRYGLGHIWQLSPTQIAVQANRRPAGVPVVDLEDGGDLFVIERLEDLASTPAIPLLRNEASVHPRNGQAITLVRYPANGGFVPLGARLADGSPHPHAGTGFGLSIILGYPADNSVKRPEATADIVHLWELQQYRFDGAEFHVEQREILGCDAVYPGAHIWRQPLGQAIPDGEDLLAGIVSSVDGQRYPGMFRWRRRDGAWRPVAHHPVPAPDHCVEPAIIRDLDGALLMSVRTNDWWLADRLRVYRSTDTGQTWELWLDDELMRSHGPVILQQTLAGEPYLITNPLRRPCIDNHGRTCHSTWMREDLHIFKLTEDRRHVQNPVHLFDARRSFGVARHDSAGHVNFWYLDHPIAANVRLADGRWHTLVPFRVCELWEVCTDASSTPYTGLWIEELHGGAPADGAAIHADPWHFEV
jgi:hypothetical protein